MSPDASQPPAPPTATPPVLDPNADEAPPLLGSWPRLYALVLANALLVMVLIAAFSAHRF